MSQRTVRVFFSSAGDLAEERHLARETLLRISTESVDFEYFGHENLLASTGARPQDAINALVDRCDVFVAMFYRRWGQPASDAAAYTSYTEEEFDRARQLLSESGAPEIFCFFKQVDLAALSDPGDQLSKVLDFRRRLEESGSVLYRPFNSATDVVETLEAHLLAFAANTLPTPRTPRRRIHVPILADRGPESDLSFEIAKASRAAEAAARGELEIATALMAGLSQSTRNIALLDVIRKFFLDIGNQDAAQAVLEKKVTLLYDRRLAANEYAAVLMSGPWLDQMVDGMLKEVPADEHDRAEHLIRRLFTGTRFNELLIDSMAEHFTVGELLALARFYRGEGASITAKMGHYMGLVIPQINATIASENPELFE